MKLLTCVLALTCLTALTTASIPPPQLCSSEDQLKCATLPIHRDAILHCWRGIWRTTALCPPHHTCESKPIPHCIYKAGGAVAKVDTRAVESDLKIKICAQDQLRCHAITPKGVSFIQRCDNNRWHAVTICNAEEKCDSASSPHCVRTPATAEVPTEVQMDTGAVESDPKICSGGQRQCTILPRIALNRHAIQHCHNNAWLTVQVCNKEDLCDSNPSPHCVRKTGAAVEERTAEVEAEVPHSHYLYLHF
jgi:hypothetical protein